MALHVAGKIVQDEKTGNFLVKIPAFDIDQDIGVASFEDLVDNAKDILRIAAKRLQIPAVVIDDPEISINLKFSVEGQKDRKLTEFPIESATGSEIE